MLLKNALKNAKRSDEDKVGLNIKVPVSLKNEFDTLCKKHGVSMTSMMLSLMETAIDEDQKSSMALPIIRNAIDFQLDYLNDWIRYFESEPDPDKFKDYSDWRNAKEMLNNVKKELE